MPSDRHLGKLAESDKIPEGISAPSVRSSFFGCCVARYVRFVYGRCVARWRVRSLPNALVYQLFSVCMSLPLGHWFVRGYLRAPSDRCFARGSIVL